MCKQNTHTFNLYKQKDKVRRETKNLNSLPKLT